MFGTMSSAENGIAFLFWQTAHTSQILDKTNPQTCGYIFTDDNRRHYCAAGAGASGVSEIGAV